MRKRLQIAGLLLALAISQTTFAQSQRIVTAGSCITEIVHALGHGDEIVATDQTSVYPASMTRLPSIGYRTGISAEGILQQRPTLILVEKEYVRKELNDQLSQAKIDFIALDKTTSWEETKILITHIGEILGEQQKATALVNELNAELSAIAAAVAKVSSRPSVLFLYARGAGTQMIAGKETFTESLIELAGGKQATDISGFKPLNTEALIVANPDYILLGDDGLQSLGGIDGVLAIPGVPQTQAGKRKQIIALNLVMMSNFGPRLPAAVKALAQLIHPEIKI